tara:strand:+ start:1019 stop:2350 length:1332 start_codon:yes stop_codon:yes gene_type:complete
MLNKSLFHIYMKIDGYDLDKSQKFINDINNLDVKSFFEWQNEQKNKIFNYHIENNNFYKNKINFKKNMTWESIPLIKKEDFQIDIEKVISNYKKINELYLGNTSGSSGHPFYFVKNKKAHSLSWALIIDRLKKIGISYPSMQARFFGIPLDNKLSLIKERIKDRIKKRYRFPLFDLSDRNLKMFYNRFFKIKFKFMWGYTNTLRDFAIYIKKNNLNSLKEICHSLDCCIPTSEMLTSEDRSLLENSFGIPCYQEYGASEFGSIAFENKKKNMILSNETLFIEIVDENGKNLGLDNIGKIVITDLFNYSMPFIRYDIGDRGSLTLDENSNTVLKALEGRENDTIILPSGKKSPGLTFYYISRSILEQSAGIIKEFIIKQIKLDTFVFVIKSNTDLDQKIIDDIKNKMDIYLEPNLNLIIKKVKKIDRNKNGKIKHFFSLINNEK